MIKIIKFYRGVKLIILNSFYFNLKSLGIYFIFLLSIHTFSKFLYLKFKNKNIALDFFNDLKKFTFTRNYFKHNPSIWYEVFKQNNYLNKKVDILEIGSFEGMSLIFFEKILNINQIFSIDIKENKNFLENTKSIKNIKYFNSSSDDFFQKNMSKKFDIIYVDGSHYFDDVYNDLINSEKILKENGILIIDDLLLDLNFRKYGYKFHEDVMGGVFKFLKLKKNNFDYIFVGHQLILKKIVL
tara:strand:+ start:3722 stop:4444 length:723 start_codon:yes stop_codon:yes gene_type:complete